jgi:Protein of unknown function (DUF3142)
MRVATTLLRLLGLSAAALCASLVLRGDSRATPNLGRSAMLAGSAPATMLWAWEEPEDLRGIDPQRVGVAFLAERVFLGNDVHAYPRRQSILVPGNAYALAVVRLEATPGFVDSSQLRTEAADAVLKVAALQKIRGIQVDFDATASQREFYADVLRQVRSRLPVQMGLTMTALVSWCASADGWLKNLPVDAAVPMYFRLGKHAGEWEIREPLCGESVGVSVDEPGTASGYSPAMRTYVFSPRPWTAQQLAILSREGFPSNLRSMP